MDAESCGSSVHDINVLTVVASESYKTFVTDLQSDIKAVLYDRPTVATSEYFKGKFVDNYGTPTEIDDKTANIIEGYLIANGYADYVDRKITDKYRNDVANGTLMPLPLDLQGMTDGIHKLVQSIFDDSVLKDYASNAKATQVKGNPLNDNFYKKEFQNLWKQINHKYAYTVSFDSAELIEKAIAHINENLVVSRLQYKTTVGSQKAEMKQTEVEASTSFGSEKTKTTTLNLEQSNGIEYDLIGKIAEGTVLTRKTVAAILKGVGKERIAMFKYNPEEFIAKVIKLINEQKATMLVAHISYNEIEGEYDSAIFTAEKPAQSFDKAFKSEKAIQDYVFTDGTAAESVEKKFAKDLDSSEEVCVYAKLPKGFHIPTPVGNYSPDWAIAFNEGSVKHIYFIAETKGSMSSMDLRPIEKAKIDCAEKLFNELSTGNVRYSRVDSFQSLMNIIG